MKTIDKVTDLNEFKHRAAADVAHGATEGMRAIIEKYNLPMEEALGVFMGPFAKAIAATSSKDLNEVIEAVEKKKGTDLTWLKKAVKE